ncbi:hypothetical protein WICMUC_003328 [Wickerhamomyces mucosus]|uniref:Uncharacterized protein n=1 Tax=Wickerhamomyces mucosus TaxID=1378264 RepID=A0A9P8PN21_9ASCO|nr:hypothetical protein WICMUC_003328 [Wickerhamomyces mucosus]
MDSNLKYGKCLFNCDDLLTDEVPTTEPSGKSANVLYGDSLAMIKASDGSSLLVMQPNSNSSAVLTSGRLFESISSSNITVETADFLTLDVVDCRGKNLGDDRVLEPKYCKSDEVSNDESILKPG